MYMLGFPQPGIVVKIICDYEGKLPIGYSALNKQKNRLSKNTTN